MIGIYFWIINVFRDIWYNMLYLSYKRQAHKYYSRVEVTGTDQYASYSIAVINTLGVQCVVDTTFTVLQEQCIFVRSMVSKRVCHCQPFLS
jgi:hypothetical protein